MTSFIDIAKEYHEAGLRVIPFWNTDNDGKRFPAGYAQYRSEQTPADIETLFNQPCDGIALLCTDGIEGIDIDVKHDPAGTIAADYIELLKESGIWETVAEHCVFQRTKSGGWHIIYKTNVIAGNQKLAKRTGGKEAVIETRGKGGILFIAPTLGYDIRFGDIFNLETISDDQRNKLIGIAKTFHSPDPLPYAHKVKAHELKEAGSKKPWEDYDEQHSVLDLVEAYGWQQLPRQSNADFIRLNRPGSGHPNDVHASVITATNVFYPFTTSTQFEPEKGYTPSAVYATVEHGGDFTAAARELYRQGFGDRIEQEPEAPVVAPEELPELIKRVEATKFDFNAQVQEPEPVLVCFPQGIHGKKYKIGAFGQIGVFLGHEKMGKSFVLGCVIASALAGGYSRLNFQLDPKRRPVLWFDLEQSKVRYQLSQKRLHWIASARANIDNYHAYNLRPLNPSERLAAIEYYIKAKRPGIVVLDGYVDLISDYNDLKESQRIVNTLMRWTDEYNLLLMGVLHLNKGDGKPRGHLGSELKNKADFMFKVQKVENNQYELSNPTNGTWPEFESFTFSRSDDGFPVVETEEIEIPETW